MTEGFIAVAYTPTIEGMIPFICSNKDDILRYSIIT